MSPGEISRSTHTAPDITMSQCHSVTVSQCHSVSVLQCHNVIMSQCHRYINKFLLLVLFHKTSQLTLDSLQNSLTFRILEELLMDYDQTERPPSQGIIFCHKNWIKVSHSRSKTALQLPLQLTYNKIYINAFILKFLILLTFIISSLNYKIWINRVLGRH